MGRAVLLVALALVSACTHAPPPAPVAPDESSMPPPLDAPSIDAPSVEAPSVDAPATAELQQAEDAVARQLTATVTRAGQPAPTRDPALDRAARALAHAARSGAPLEGPGRLRVLEAVGRHGASDPAPRLVQLQSRYVTALDTALEGRDDVLAAEPTTHLGVGAVQHGGEVVLVALLSARKAELDPFPRSVPTAGAAERLCGALVPRLRAPELYLTRPDGEVEHLWVDAEHGARFCVRVPLPAPGRYVLQVVGHAQTGVEIAAVFGVDVGGPEATAPTACCGADPASLPETRKALLARINVLRRTHGAGHLGADPRLDRVAQAYAERMAREHFFAHVAPDGSRLRDRFARVGLRTPVMGENLARADSALAAQASLEDSPAHRGKLLERGFTHVGLGLGERALPGGKRQAVLVQVFARLRPSDAR